MSEKFLLLPVLSYSPDVQETEYGKEQASQQCYRHCQQQGNKAV